MNEEDALNTAYKIFGQYSKKYTVDFDRYLFSLKLLSKIPHLNKKKVLDIGTGIGLMPLSLKKMGVEAKGLDYYIFPESNNKMFCLSEISDYKKIWQNNGLKVFNENIFDPNLVSKIGTFDVILSEATIEHLKDPRYFLEQCWKLLNADGYVLITTPNLTTLTKRLRFLFGRSPYWPIESFFTDGEKFTGHWREYSIPELRYMCVTTGFSITETYNKNMLAKFKSFSSWRKNLRAVLVNISNIVPGSREMNFVLAKKQLSISPHQSK